MGANAEIRSFRPAVPTVQRSLLDPSVDHTPTIARLLSTPWVRRGSDLATEQTSRIGHRADGPVTVEVDPSTDLPVSIVRRPGHTYRVVRVLERWVVDQNWHRPEAHISQRHYRVAAARTGAARHAATFGLVHDLAKEEWRLTGIHD